jgi:hypothetical protein
VPVKSPVAVSLTVWELRETDRVVVGGGVLEKVGDWENDIESVKRIVRDIVGGGEMVRDVVGVGGGVSVRVAIEALTVLDLVNVGGGVIVLVNDGVARSVSDAVGSEVNVSVGVASIVLVAPVGVSEAVFSLVKEPLSVPVPMGSDTVALTVRVALSSSVPLRVWPESVEVGEADALAEAVAVSDTETEGDPVCSSVTDFVAVSSSEADLVCVSTLAVMSLVNDVETDTVRLMVTVRDSGGHTIG